MERIAGFELLWWTSQPDVPYQLKYRINWAKCIFKSYSSVYKVFWRLNNLIFFLGVAQISEESSYMLVKWITLFTKLYVLISQTVFMNLCPYRFWQRLEKGSVVLQRCTGIAELRLNYKPFELMLKRSRQLLLRI
jgi:hypothetical protein